MADNLLKIDKNQRKSLDQWLADPQDFDPNTVFGILGSAMGVGKYPSQDELRPSPLDTFAERIGYTTDKMKLLGDLQRDTQRLQPFVQEMLKFKAINVMAQANAPTYQESQARGVPLPFPSKTVPIEEFGPGAPLQVASPRTLGFTPDELAQPTATHGSRLESLQDLEAARSRPFFEEGPRPFGTTTVPDPTAKLSRPDLNIYNQVLEGRGIVEEGGRYIPTTLAKLPGSMVSADEANKIADAAGLTLAKPFTSDVASSTLNQLLKAQGGENQPPLIKLQLEANRLMAIPEAQRTPGQRSMLQTVTEGIERQTIANENPANQWASALFGKGVSYKNLDAQPPVTPAQSRRWKQEFDVTIPVGTAPNAAIKIMDTKTKSQVMPSLLGLTQNIVKSKVAVGQSGTAQEWRDPVTAQAAPSWATPEQLMQMGFVNIEPTQANVLAQAQTVDQLLREILTAGTALTRHAVGTSFMDVPAGILQKPLLNLITSYAGDPNAAVLESAVTRLAPVLGRMAGDVHISNIDQTAYRNAVFSPSDTVESVIAKIRSVDHAQKTVKKSMGFLPDETAFIRRLANKGLTDKQITDILDERKSMQ